MRDVLNLTSLKTRRTRNDLIQKYKLINRIDEINWEFEPALLSPRGGHRGLYERELIKDNDQRFYFFNNRAAQDWNYLKIIDRQVQQKVLKTSWMYILKTDSSSRFSSPSINHHHHTSLEGLSGVLLFLGTTKSWLHSYLFTAIFIIFLVFLELSRQIVECVTKFD